MYTTGIYFESFLCLLGALLIIGGWFCLSGVLIKSMETIQVVHFFSISLTLFFSFFVCSYCMYLYAISYIENIESRKR